MHPTSIGLTPQSPSRQACHLAIFAGLWLNVTGARAAGAVPNFPDRQEFVISGRVLDGSTRNPVGRFNVQVLTEAQAHERGLRRDLIRFGSIDLIEDMGWHSDHSALKSIAVTVDGGNPRPGIAPRTRQTVGPYEILTDPGATGLPEPGFMLGSEFFDGRFALKSFSRTPDQAAEVYLKVLSKEHEQKIFGPYRLRASSTPLNLTLSRSTGFAVTLTSQSGRSAPPLSNFDVLVTRMDSVELDAEKAEFRLPKSLPPRLTRLATDARGRFTIPPELQHHDSVWVAHSNGFAHASVEQLRGSRQLVLQPWGRIDGRWTINGRGAAGEVLRVQPQFNSGGGSSPQTHLQAEFKAETDAEGRFQIPRLPAGPAILYRGVRAGRAIVYIGNRDLEIKAGEATELVCAEVGGTVRGRVVWPEPRPPELEPTFGFFRASLATSGLENHDWPASGWNGYSLQNGAYQRLYPVALGSDGSFRADGLPPGRYQMLLDFWDARETSTPPPRRDPSRAVGAPVLATINMKFTMPDGELAKVDLGPQQLTVLASGPITVPGEVVPPLEFMESTGERRTLADFAGHAVCLVIGDDSFDLSIRGQLLPFASPRFQERLKLIYLATQTDRSRTGFAPPFAQGWVMGKLAEDAAPQWIRSVGGSGRRVVCLINSQGRLEAIDPPMIDLQRQLRALTK